MFEDWIYAGISNNPYLPQLHRGVLVQRIGVVLYDGRLTGVALTVKFTESQRRLNSIKHMVLKYSSYLDVEGLRGISSLGLINPDMPMGLPHRYHKEAAKLFVIIKHFSGV